MRKSGLITESRKNVLLMLCIFVLAGAFASVAGIIGGVKAMVDMTLWLLPSSLILVGVFMAACLVSLSVGTSCGT
ncbi:MAG: Na+/H+ antiporter NhaC family protein, partial [Bacteroidaceae bacterium]|nr:Na+/H+ antiporter NhaC family protein [Bacteroidaceae bacterium]